MEWKNQEKKRTVLVPDLSLAQEAPKLRRLGLLGERRSMDWLIGFVGKIITGKPETIGFSITSIH